LMTELLIGNIWKRIYHPDPSQFHFNSGVCKVDPDTQSSSGNGSQRPERPLRPPRTAMTFFRYLGGRVTSRSHNPLHSHLLNPGFRIGRSVPFESRTCPQSDYPAVCCIFLCRNNCECWRDLPCVSELTRWLKRQSISRPDHSTVIGSRPRKGRPSLSFDEGRLCLQYWPTWVCSSWMDHLLDNGNRFLDEWSDGRVDSSATSWT
jgi:hypothetical protein